MDAEVGYAGLGELAQRLARGEVSSVELVDYSLARIEATQPSLNAFRSVRADQARADAAEADRRLAAGERLLLLGVPVAIKDDMDLAGDPTRCGCPGDFAVKPADGEAARRLKAAGAVIVGKTNLPEFGQWPFTEGRAFGATRNPWHLDHVPGGSSGGSAAAVAAGVVPAALGSDGAGSVRIPAAWTHLVGIKPQRGRISTWPDAEAFHGLTGIGPLARTVEDAALLLDAARGNHRGDRHQPAEPAEPYVTAARRDPGRLRIALSLRPPFSGFPASLDPGVRAAVRRLADVLAGLGHDVAEADPRYGLIGWAFLPRSLVGVREWIQRVPDPALLDPRTRHNGRQGSLMQGPILAAARRAEARQQAAVGRIFDRADIVLAPTTATPPPRVGAHDGLTNRQTDAKIIAACPYAWPWNVLGWPAVNVPAGFSAGGLPLGAQLMGPAHSEARLIGLAAQLQDVQRWQDHRPPVTEARVPEGRRG